MMQDKNHNVLDNNLSSFSQKSSVGSDGGIQKISSEYNNYLDLFTQLNIIEDTFEFVHLIFHFDPYQCVHAGSAFEKIYGYSCKEIYNYSDLFYEVVHPEDIDYMKKQINTVIKTGYHEFNYRIIAKNGEMKYLKTNVWYQQDGGQSFLMTCFQKDITGQMETGNSLKRSMQKHHYLTEVAITLNSTEDFEHKLQLTIDKIGNSLQPDQVTLYEIANDQMFYRCVWAKQDPVIPLGIVLKVPPLTFFPEYVNIIQYSEGEIPERVMQFWEISAQVQELLIIPVRIKNEIFGFVEIISKKKRKWKDEDLSFVCTVGNIMANFYDRKIINDELNLNYLNKELIANVSFKLNQYTSNDEHVLKTVLGYIALNYPGTESVYIYIYDKENNTFRKNCDYTNPSILLRHNYQDEYDGSLFENILPVLNEGKTFCIDDLSQDSSEFCKLLYSSQIKSVLIAPLFVNSNLHGFLGFSMFSHYHAWNKSRLELTQSLAICISHFIERQFMMKNLKSNEKKIKDISANLPGCMFQITLSSTEDITLDYISPQFEQWAGLKPPQKIELKKLLQNIHRDDKEAFLNMKKELERFYSEISFEGRFYFPSSVYKSLIMKATLLEMKPTGEITYNGLIMDLTENKQIELNLSDAKISIQSIINNLEESILLIDDYNNVLYFNENIEKMLGSDNKSDSDPAEMLDATFQLVKDSIAIKSYTRNIMKKRLEERDKELFFYKTAEFFTRDYIPIFRENRFFAHLFIFRNITHSNLQDIEVQKSFKRVCTIIEHSDVGVVLLGKNEKVVIVNNQFLRMFYIKEIPSFFINQLFRVLWNKMCENVQIEGIERDQILDIVSSGKRIINQEILINDISTLQCIIEPVVFENQIQTGIHETLIQIIDISPQKNIEQTLRIAKKEAEEITNAKSHIFTSISHEILTPLTGILGLSSILKEKLCDSELHNMAEEIEQSGRRLLGLMNSVLDFSTVQSEAKPFKKTSVNINHVIREQINVFNSMAMQKGLYLYAEIEGVLGIAVNEKILSKILHNLINNGIKYTLTGGVKVEANIIPVVNNEWLDIRIIDSGVGIEEYKHRTIFEPFRQESEGCGRAYEGTGLGLSLVKEYIEKLNGKIHLSSRKDKGSTFMILLPNAYYVNNEIQTEIIGTPPDQVEEFNGF